MRPARDMRRSRRVPMEGRIALAWSDDRGRLWETRGRLRDVSGQGVGAEVRDPVPKGALVSVSVRPAGWRRSGIVRHCSRAGNRYLLGIEGCDITWCRYG